MPDEVVHHPRRTTSIHCRLALVLVVLHSAVVPSLSLAQPARPASSPAAKPATSAPWSSLTANQKLALAPLERDWASLDAPRRSKWLEIAAKFPSMPSDEQVRMLERMKEWARMTPAERGRARLSFQDAKQLAPRDRQAQWEAYQALPEADRRAFAAKASAPAAVMPRQPLAAGAASSKGMAASAPGLSAALAGPPTKPIRPITPTLVQGGPGATTTPISRMAAPPAHQHVGQPKIAAAPGQVDRATLLPRKPGTPVPPLGSSSSAPKTLP